MSILRILIPAVATVGGLLLAGARESRLLAQASAEKAGSPASRPAESRAVTSQPASRPASQPASTQPAGPPQVVIETSLGRIVVELDPERAPRTTENFLAYVDSRFYDDTLFHRVIKGFMNQGGGFTTAHQPKPPTRPPVRNESRHTARNTRGTIAMARSGHPDSATCQFFINTVDNRPLDFDGPYGGYTVFGKVVEGMDVVDRIASVSVRRGPLSPAQPIEDVVIESIRRKSTTADNAE